MDKSLGMDLFNDPENFDQQFQNVGSVLESRNKYELYNYAIPVKVQDNIIGYVMVGPVILNRRLEREQYVQMAQENGIDPEYLIGNMNEIRVLSNIMMNSIFNLLSEIVKNNVDLSLRETPATSVTENSKNLPKEFDKIANEIYSTVRLDELLVTLLDVALKMTETECGSIMVYDEKQGYFTIKVSKGLDNKKIQEARVKLGEGIAGLAASENSHFLIKGKKGDNRIKHLLNRPEIKHSLVLPLTSKNRVFGVLNLHTYQDRDKIQDNLDNLKYLSQLLSSAF